MEMPLESTVCDWDRSELKPKDIDMRIERIDVIPLDIKLDKAFKEARM